MTLLPVIQREVRVAARTPATYWLRVVGAAALLLVGAAFWRVEGVRGVGFSQGASWFGMMHQMLFWTIWVLVPVMTADCISRERREGTLGLLFLTPLKARDIVLAKGFVHGLRAVTLAIAGVPVLVLPFLTGGVGWIQALSSVLINFSALCWALGAGVLASSRGRTFTQSIVRAVAIAGVGFVVMGLLQGVAIVCGCIAVAPKASPLFPRTIDWKAWLLAAGFQSLTDAGRFLHDFLLSFGGSTVYRNVWLMALSSVALLSLLALVCIIAWAAFNVRRNWQDKPRSVLQTKLEKEFCTPVYGVRLFRGWMRRLVERNPIGWLERRTWQARTVSWAWLAVIISLYSAMLGGTRPDRGMFQAWQWIITILFCTSLAASAAGSFRRERESGVMELLLVTPLTAGQIITGRLRGLWGQFLLALILLLVMRLQLANFPGLLSGDPQRGIEEAWRSGLLGTTVLTLPLMGLYFSLRCRLFITALLGTVIAGVGLPWLITEAVTAHLDSGAHLGSGLLIAVLVSAFAACWRQCRDYRPLLLNVALAWLVVAMVAWLVYRMTGSSIPDWAYSDQRQVKAMMEAALFCALLQTGGAAWLATRLHRNLVKRRFALPQ
jgi:ABC-type transport system involved in multi-copper enzyme maturation permease subunit